MNESRSDFSNLPYRNKLTTRINRFQYNMLKPIKFPFPSVQLFPFFSKYIKYILILSQQPLLKQSVAFAPIMVCFIVNTIEIENN